MDKVTFVGAGPGDPELLTIKGKKAIDGADLIIYTGSLVNPEVLRDSQAEIVDSAGLTLEEVIEKIKGARGKKIVRVHTGDPSMYGAIREQIDLLEDLGFECEVIPGVSSVFAGAASLKSEFTLPGISQTLILTRIEGRTPVPEKESLEKLAQARASMAIFLSVGRIKEVQQKLLEAYPPGTPVAVVYKASWPEEEIYRGTLKDLAKTVEDNNITRTALIYVGDFLGSSYERSKLYDAAFSHGYRSGSK